MSLASVESGGSRQNTLLFESSSAHINNNEGEQIFINLPRQNEEWQQQPQQLKRRKRGRRLSLHREYNYSDFEAASVLREWIRPKPVNKFLMKYNTLCEICANFNPSDIGSHLLCIYCNVMCHVDCVQRWNATGRHFLQEKHRRELAQSRHRDADVEWMCFYCIDYLDYSRQQHDADVQRILRKSKQVKAQTLIAKTWRRYRDRRRYLRVYALMVHIQIVFRVHKQQVAFVAHVRNRLRPMKLRFTQLVDSAAEYIDDKTDRGRTRVIKENSVYLLVSVLGSSKLTGILHTWRLTTDLVPIEKPTPAQQQLLQERSRLQSSGISSEVAAVLSAAKNVKPNRGKRRRSILSSKAADEVKLPSVSMDTRVLLGGISGNQIIVVSAFQKGLLKDTFLGQTHVDLSNDQQNPHIWRRGGVFYLPLQEQEFPIKDAVGMDMKIDPRLHPQPRGHLCFEVNPMRSSMSAECGYVYGPCVEDILRVVQRLPSFPGLLVPRTVTGATVARSSIGSSIAALSSSEGYAVPVKRIWLAIADGVFYLYSHFGDALKLIVNVEFFRFSTEVSNKMIHYRLHFAGYPDLVFHNVSTEETLRWKCAFLSCRRYDRVGGAASNTSYDMDALINDIVALDLERARKGAHLKPSDNDKSSDFKLLGSSTSSSYGKGKSYSTKSAVSGSSVKFASIPGFRLEHLHEERHNASLMQQHLKTQSPLDDLFERLEINSMITSHQAAHEQLRKDLRMQPKLQPLHTIGEATAGFNFPLQHGFHGASTPRRALQADGAATEAVSPQQQLQLLQEQEQCSPARILTAKIRNPDRTAPFFGSSSQNRSDPVDETKVNSGRSERKQQHKEPQQSSSARDIVMRRMRPQQNSPLPLLSPKSPMGSSRRHDTIAEDPNAARMQRIEMIKTKLKEEYDIEESSMNQKFVRYGEDFVTRVLAKHAQHVITKEAAAISTATEDVGQIHVASRAGNGTGRSGGR